MPATTNMIRPVKRIICLAMVLCLMTPSAFAISTQDSLTIGIISSTTVYMNPLIPVEREFMSLTNLVYEGLVAFDDAYKPQPCLCEKWESSSNGNTWSFTLRSGLTFHDGSPLTAHDVVASAKAIIALSNGAEKDPEGQYAQLFAMAGKSAGAYAALKYYIKDISANDNLTVVIKTDRNNFGFLYAMNFPVLPAAQVQSPSPSGTGPYYIEQFVPKDFLLLGTNSTWWKGFPAMNEIMVIFHSANRELISSYEYNRVDSIMTRSLTAAQYRSGVNTLNMSFRTPQLETLMLNNRSRELEDLKVRKAIRYAININSILSSEYMGMALQTATPMFPGTWMYNEEAIEQRYDPEKAKALLEEAGWSDSDEDGVRDMVIGGEMAKLHLSFIAYEEQDNHVRIAAANKIVSDLTAVGIECKLDILNFADTKAKLKAGSFDLALCAFNMDSVPDPGFLLMTNNVANYARYSNPDMDALFKTLRSSLSESDYRNALLQIQTRFWADCPFICLYFRKGAVLTRKMFTAARDIREPEILRGIAEGMELQKD